MGANRAIAVGEADITNLFLGYQCPKGYDAVLTGSPDVLGKPLSIRGDPSTGTGGKYNCKQCKSNRYWWWSNTGSNYIKLSEKEFLAKRAKEGGGGYVASCD